MSSSDDSHQLSDRGQLIGRLVDAIKFKNHEEFSRLLDENATGSLVLCTESLRISEPAFHVAVIHGEVSMVRRMLELGVGVDLAIPSGHASLAGQSGLHIAATRGDLDTVKCLVGRNADTNWRDSKRQTPLHKACHRGFVRIIQFLCEEGGCDVNVQDADGQSPLYIVSLESHTALISLLIEKGANIDLVDNMGRTALHSAVNKEDGDERGAEELLKNGSDINVRDKKGKSALHVACSRKNVRAVTHLLTHGIDTDLVDRSGQSALHTATCADCATVRALLSFEPDVNLQNNSGKTPLILAATLASELKQKLRAPPKNGECFQSEHTLQQLHETCKHLIHQQGVLLNLYDRYGRSALHYAALWNDSRIAKSLLRRDVSVNSQDVDGKTPLHYASSVGNHDVVQRMISKGADANIRDNEGRMPLHEAAKSNNLNLVKCLLAVTVDPHLGDKHGKTPHDYAQSDDIKAEIEKTDENLATKSKKIRTTNLTVCDKSTGIKDRLQTFRRDLNSNVVTDADLDAESREDIDQTLRKLTSIADNPDVRDVTVSEETWNAVFHHVAGVIGSDWEELFTRLMVTHSQDVIGNYLDGIKMACDKNPFMKVYHALSYWKVVSDDRKLKADVLIDTLLDMGKKSLAFKLREMAYNDLNKKRLYLRVTTQEAMKCLQKITIEVQNMKQTGEDIPNDLLSQLHEINREVRGLLREVTSEVSQTLVTTIACNRIFSHLARFMGPREAFKLYRNLMVGHGATVERIDTNWQKFESLYPDNAYRLVLAAMMDWKQSVGQESVDVEHITRALREMDNVRMADSVREIYFAHSI